MNINSIHYADLIYLGLYSKAFYIFNSKNVTGELLHEAEMHPSL